MNLLINALRNSVEAVGEGLGLSRTIVTYAPNSAGALVVGLVMSRTDLELATLNTRPQPAGPDDAPVEPVPVIEVIKGRLMVVARARGLPHAHTAHKSNPKGGLVVALVIPETRPGEWTRR